MLKIIHSLIDVIFIWEIIVDTPVHNVLDTLKTIWSLADIDKELFPRDNTTQLNFEEQILKSQKC